MYEVIDGQVALGQSLPEDILKKKWAGDLEGALRAIDCRLARPELPQVMRDRLECEKERLRRLPTQYPWTEDQAVEQMRTLVPDFTAQDLREWEDRGLVDFIYLHGEKRYFVRFHRSLVKNAPLADRSGYPLSPENPRLDGMIETMRREGSLERTVTLRTGIGVEEKSFVPGVYRAWLPIPAPCAQQRDIEILSGHPDRVAPEDAPARTAYWEQRLDAPEHFTVTYRYTQRMVYADPLNAPAPAEPLYPAARPVSPEDLGEVPPFVRVSPAIAALARELAGEETEPVRKAWRFYEFITTRCMYTFMRDYFQLDDVGDFCAVNLRGDCGLQALLFINLCRAAGIPARWQSGMSIDDEGPGSHDWAQFWLEGWGWLFCDPSFGGSAWRNGNKVRHAFYFGNLEPMRMVANRAFQAPLTPPFPSWRVDPYDNQSGEICRVGAELPFTGRQTDTFSETVEVR